MSNQNIEQLKYPVGRFKRPENYTPESRKEAINILKQLPDQLRSTLQDMDEDQLNTPYRVGGWTVKQLVHHISDSHLNSYTRFKLGLTENNPTIRPYDQDAWANTIDADLDTEVSLNIIAGIHTKLTKLIEAFSNEDYSRTVFHPEMEKKISLDYLTAMYAWHSRHHLAHIENLKDRMNW